MSERQNEQGMKRKPVLVIQWGFKDGERMLQAPAQFAAVMNIRAAA